MVWIFKNNAYENSESTLKKSEKPWLRGSKTKSNHWKICILSHMTCVFVFPKIYFLSDGLFRYLLKLLIFCVYESYLGKPKRRTYSKDACIGNACFQKSQFSRRDAYSKIKSKSTLENHKKASYLVTNIRIYTFFHLTRFKSLLPNSSFYFP